MLEGRRGPTGTAVFDSAVAESTPFPKGPPKSSVEGTPRCGWPPPGVDLSVRHNFRPGRSSASRGSGGAKQRSSSRISTTS